MLVCHLSRSETDVITKVFRKLTGIIQKELSSLPHKHYA